MNLAWTIEFDRKAIGQLRKLDRPTRERVKSFLNQRVASLDDPRLVGKGLKTVERRSWRYRVGAYRITCKINFENRVIKVNGVARRDKAYRSYLRAPDTRYDSKGGDLRMPMYATIPPEIQERIEALAKRTGRTIAQITYDVIEAGLGDAEETYRAIQARDKLRRGEEAEFSAELLKEMYDLEV